MNGLTEPFTIRNGSKASRSAPIGGILICDQLRRSSVRNSLLRIICPGWSFVVLLRFLVNWVQSSWSLIQFTRNRSEEHTSELQSHHEIVCRLLLVKKKIRPPFTLPPPSSPCSPRSCPLI